MRPAAAVRRVLQRILQRIDPRAARNGALTLAAALVFGGLALHGSAIDHRLFGAINAWGPLAPALWSALSVAGLGISALLVAGAAGPRGVRMLAALCSALLFGGFLVHALKLAAGAARPLAVLGPDSVHLIGIALGTHSMPSGHAALAFAVLVLLLGSAAPPRRTLARLAVAAAQAMAALAMALSVALSRVAVGAHWPSDVLVGAGIGIGTGLVLCATRNGRRWVRGLAARLAHRVGSRLVAAALVVAASALWVAERDYPLAGWLHGVLAAAGLLGAVSWWQLHPGHAHVRRTWLLWRGLRWRTAGP